jgi:glutamate-1-semialdehyde 2,1-aminomutase
LFPSGDVQPCQSTTSSAGVAPSTEVNTLVAPFNDLTTTREIVMQHAEELAAIIVEPLQRCVTPQPGFLAGLSELARSAGTVLIFDEVVTGFRLAYGGAQEYYGVVPDLVAYGKALGGGLPIGAFGGRREIMDLVREDRMGRDKYVWMASTLGGNPISAAAANAALRIFRHSTCYPRLQQLGKYLRTGLERVLDEFDLEAVVLGDGPLAQIAFTTADVRDYRSSRHLDPNFARRLMLELFARGVFLNPMGTKLYLSLAHEEATCDELCGLLADALQTILAGSEGTSII